MAFLHFLALASPNSAASQMDRDPRRMAVAIGSLVALFLWSLDRATELRVELPLASLRYAGRRFCDGLGLPEIWQVG